MSKRKTVLYVRRVYGTNGTPMWAIYNASTERIYPFGPADCQKSWEIASKCAQALVARKMSIDLYCYDNALSLIPPANEIQMPSTTNRFVVRRGTYSYPDGYSYHSWSVVDRRTGRAYPFGSSWRTTLATARGFALGLHKPRNFVHSERIQFPREVSRRV